jgi:hypothetical protein
MNGGGCLTFILQVVMVICVIACTIW